MDHEVGECTPEVSLTQRNHPIQAFLFDGPNKALRMRIAVRGRARFSDTTSGPSNCLTPRVCGSKLRCPAAGLSASSQSRARWWRWISKRDFEWRSWRPPSLLWCWTPQCPQRAEFNQARLADLAHPCSETDTTWFQTHTAERPLARRSGALPAGQIGSPDSAVTKKAAAALSLFRADKRYAI
jgi:hypothetical protein